MSDKPEYTDAALNRTISEKAAQYHEAPSSLVPAIGSAVEMAKRDITRLEEALKPALQLARIAHSSAMRASEELGKRSGTGAAHSCLALMEAAMRALNQGNDAARYSRHSMEYPSNAEVTDK